MATVPASVPATGGTQAPDPNALEALARLQARVPPPRALFPGGASPGATDAGQEGATTTPPGPFYDLPQVTPAGVQTVLEAHIAELEQEESTEEGICRYLQEWNDKAPGANVAEMKDLVATDSKTRAYLIMRLHDPLLNVVYGITQFTAPSESPYHDYKGKFIAILGDNKLGSAPRRVPSRIARSGDFSK